MSLITTEFLQYGAESAYVGVLRLNRPELHNAFGDLMIAELIQALDALAAMPGLRVLLLESTGKNFSAGADLNWMRAMAQKDYQQNLTDAGALALLMQKLNSFPLPVIALVQGAAFGGAVGLVACCDMAIATPKASFCLSEVKIGLIPAVISPYVVRAIGERASRRYFTTAERFDAKTALQLGLISEIAGSDLAGSEEQADLRAKAQPLINAIIANSPQAVVAAKALVAYVADAPLTPDTIAETSRRIAAIRVSSEGQEGLTAFLDKRTPTWQQPTSAGQTEE
ncbi:enoyl-CoA hydratase-related protein [Rheinheimera texasensis]|uniref:enoyl-CoA hydratase-related protein n=1 Tax=Rheinheimera texasensis TaxID=306205 RepID=UPI0009FF05F4|nr:enoyl-CoA hydratase-related protein [Rheinheimera texasensis]